MEAETDKSVNVFTQKAFVLSLFDSLLIVIVNLLPVT